ncbi:hypothetical protein SAMN04489844_4222 [Nocardioides exalbidus]|uniref:DUF2029 domain-containing protein n=1 Tax=Nocardioides exalbidus TaxID=402596 RepID=A0A1H4ZYE9_9ACTN|nr:hypothetical protein [Nocardioides exalbidus]SED34491.1 hypothetical protein SAMN04489844_4222 [Nocardioides exalbidus]
MTLPRPSSGDARALTAVLGVLCLSATPASPQWVVPVALAAATACCLVVVLRAQAPTTATGGTPGAVPLRDRLVIVLVVLSATSCGIQVGSRLLDGVAPLGVAAGYGALAWWAVRAKSVGPLALLAVVHATALVVGVHALDVRIDVAEFVNGGIRALLDGASPYGITIPDVYSPEESLAYFGPGVVVDGRVLYGYPYLPTPLLLDVPGYLLGDVRYVHVAALVGCAVVARAVASDALGRALAVAVLTAPTSMVVVLAHAVEPVMALLLCLGAVGLLRGSRAVGVLLGLYLASKQYLVVVLPALWVVRRAVGWRRVVEACAVAAVVIGAFLLWDPRGFVRSALLLQLRQPFRDDAVSLLPLVAGVAGPLPGWLLATVPLAVGGAVSVLLVRRLRPGATTFLLACSLPLTCTVLVSKQSFANYFVLLGTGLLLAAVTWAVDDPVADEPDRLGARDVPQPRR